MAPYVVTLFSVQRFSNHAKIHPLPPTPATATENENYLKATNAKNGGERYRLTSQQPVFFHWRIRTMALFFLLALSLLSLLYYIVRPRPVRIPIKSRHVFVSGSSSGIGLAPAGRAAVEGARVSILARDAEKLEEEKEAIGLSTGIDFGVFSADVRDFNAVKKAVEQAGPIDVLVCNQGVFMPKELKGQVLDEVKFMIDVNLMGTFHLIKAALPSMKKYRKEQGPAPIAIISSQAGLALGENW
ncbi:3-dehydrosphinganine reductase tsc10b [Ancistrocladus abbreviatus]